MNLNNYVRVARYDLPVPPAPTGNDLALEVSAVMYDWDSDSLFLLGDEGTSIVEVSKTGEFISTMALPAGAIADPEALTYIGGDQFVLTEERTRTAFKFTYEGGTMLSAGAVQKVDLGTDVGNIGIEGIAFDPSTNGFVLVKESGPQGIFQTTIDFANGTASNGSSTTVNSNNLFDPPLVGAIDFADVFALSALPATVGTGDEDNILILSQESGVVYEVNRDGSIVSKLTLVGDADNALPIAGQGHEGLTMDRDGNLYVVSEQGGEGGADTVNGMAGKDFLFGKNGDDVLNGGVGNDRLYGGTDTDYLNGGDGDDVIYGDNASGGNNEGFADVFAFDSDDGSDQVFDFEAGLDTVLLLDGTIFTLTYARGNTFLTYGDTFVRFFSETLMEADITFVV